MESAPTGMDMDMDDDFSLYDDEEPTLPLMEKANAYPSKSKEAASIYFLMDDMTNRTRNYGRFGPSPIIGPDFLSRLQTAVAAHREGDAMLPDALRAAVAAIAAAADDADAVAAA